MIIRSITCAAVVSVGLLVGAANAHGVWVAERHGENAVVYGHGADDDAYSPDRIKSLVAKAADGTPVELVLEQREDHILFKPNKGIATVSVELDNGIWTMDKSKKWHNKAKSDIPDAVSAGHYIKYGVALLKSIGDDIKPQGLEFQIVPLEDPMSLKAGDELSIQVLYDGEPAKDVEIMAEYTTQSEVVSAHTDADGKATIKVRNQGLNVVAADLREKPEDKSEADQLGYMATFSFTLPH
nr:DUF4198 domain-containing protein [uncultured Cohaesibacter sp.]